MTVLYDQKSDTESTTTSTTWVDKLSISGTISVTGEDPYVMVWAFCELTGTSTTDGVACRITVDGTEYARHELLPPRVDSYQSVAMMGSGQLTGGISHTMVLQFVSENAAETAKIRRARFLIIQH